MAGEALFPVALSEAKYPVDVEESLRLRLRMTGNKNARFKHRAKSYPNTRISSVSPVAGQIFPQSFD